MPHIQRPREITIRKHTRLIRRHTSLGVHRLRLRLLRVIVRSPPRHHISNVLPPTDLLRRCLILAYLLIKGFLLLRSVSLDLVKHMLLLVHALLQNRGCYTLGSGDFPPSTGRWGSDQDMVLVQFSKSVELLLYLVSFVPFAEELLFKLRGLLLLYLPHLTELVVQ